MKILLASSEVHPYSKTGGLADMVGALAKALAATGHQVGVVTPLYRGIRERFPDIEAAGLASGPAAGGGTRARRKCWAWSRRAADGLLRRPAGFLFRAVALSSSTAWITPDNAERFIFFSKAVAHLARNLPWQPELVHVHDWQVGLVPLLIQHEKRLTGWGNAPRTCADHS